MDELMIHVSGIGIYGEDGTRAGNVVLFAGWGEDNLAVLFLTACLC